MEHKAYVYGYFASTDFDYTDFNDKTNVTSEFKFKDGECMYIGIATTSIEERHQNHMKPSKYDGKEGQVINRVLQDNADKWERVKLGEIDMVIEFSKPLVHSLEMELVNQYQPKVNIYGR